jgi:hypothetical protein
MRSAVEGRRTAAVGGGPAQLGAPQEGSDGGDDSLSNWFRSRRISATGVGTGSSVRHNPGGQAATGGWSTAAEPRPGDGWHSGTDSLAQQRHAAEIIADPIRGDQTAAGLPVRVPKANLIPGSAGGVRQGGGPRPAAGYDGPGSGPHPLPQRSPEMARSRLTGFQRGARRAEGQQQRAGEGADS